MAVDVYGWWSKYTCSCIILHCTTFVDVAACWPRPYRYSIVCCPRRGTMQLHTLLGMEAVDMHMHCICALWCLFKFYVGMKWIWGVLFLFIWGVSFYSYVEVVYLLYIMSSTSLWKFYWISCILLVTSLWQCYWINKLTINYYFHMLYILLWLNRCLIKL